MRTTVRKLLPVALTAAIISACADAPTSTLNLTPSRHAAATDVPQVELVTLCKVGPAGTYTFDATASHAILLNEANPVVPTYELSAATYTIVVTAGSTISVGGNTVQGACYDFQGHNHIALAGGSITATVTVVEDESTLPTDVDFDHVVVTQNDENATPAVSSTSSTTNSASGLVGGVNNDASLGSNITFFNVAVTPPGLEGCTPGFWKNNADKKGASQWPVATNTLFSDVFGANDDVAAGTTLLQALNLGGGGANALARHAAAAYLNSLSAGVDYAYSTTEVVNMVSAALASNDYETAKNLLAAANEAGCPISQNP